MATAVPAGSVVRGARNLPGKPSAEAKPVHASPAAASAPKQGTAKTPAPINGTTHPVSGNTQSAQQSIQNQNQQHSQQATSQNTATAASAQQEQAPFPKKTFIPLSGKQPESIPSHLDLKQEPQKSTKRPADPMEGGSNVTE